MPYLEGIVAETRRELASGSFSSYSPADHRGMSPALSSYSASSSHRSMSSDAQHFGMLLANAGLVGGGSGSGASVAGYATGGYGIVVGTSVAGGGQASTTTPRFIGSLVTPNYSAIVRDQMSSSGGGRHSMSPPYSDEASEPAKLLEASPPHAPWQLSFPDSHHSHQPQQYHALHQQYAPSMSLQHHLVVPAVRPQSQHASSSLTNNAISTASAASNSGSLPFPNGSPLLPAASTAATVSPRNSLQRSPSFASSSAGSSRRNAVPYGVVLRMLSHVQEADALLDKVHWKKFAGEDFFLLKCNLTPLPPLPKKGEFVI